MVKLNIPSTIQQIGGSKYMLLPASVMKELNVNYDGVLIEVTNPGEIKVRFR